jgi:hypothetical protein
MSNLAGIVKQIAVATEAETVILELICGDVYGAQVLHDDIASRLKTDRVLSLIVKVGGRSGRERGGHMNVAAGICWREKTPPIQHAPVILRNAAGEPPLERSYAGATFFRDDQGEMFVHPAEAYRTPATRIGILELDNGRWLALPPSFHVERPQYDSREAALRAGSQA